ncbi:MAG: hypothetical protein FJ170_03265 [Gammaproteobacteria bacterium]|nr:hypothetical protein [Gammaproteobacteria bacterium]
MRLIRIPLAASHCSIVLGLAFCIGLITPAYAVWNSEDGSLEVRGFVDNMTNVRDEVGLTKQRVQGQLELFKQAQPRGIFSDLSMGATFRVSYDAVYDINDDEYGRSAGGPLSYSMPGNPAFFSYINGFAPPFTPPTNIVYAGTFGPDFTGADGAIPLPGPAARSTRRAIRMTACGLRPATSTPTRMAA